MHACMRGHGRGLRLLNARDHNQVCVGGVCEPERSAMFGGTWKRKLSSVEHAWVPLLFAELWEVVISCPGIWGHGGGECLVSCAVDSAGQSIDQEVHFYTFHGRWTTLLFW